MNSRIQKIIEEEGLSISKFADEIGVQQSSVSHILSGRNKPSLDFINKLLNRYREINANWLITGCGEMYKTNNLQNIGTEKDNSNIILEEKIIKKIIVYYSDNSFEELFPNK